MADDGLIQPNAIVEEYTVRAREANASLRKTWDSWIENGRPIYAFELQLEDEVIPNDPEQRPQDTQRWRESMGAFLRREGWHESQPTGFTKAERVNLMHILARLDEVQAYRTRFGQTKGEQKLQRHNNPSQVWRAFLKDIGELKTKEGGKKSTLKESVADLQEQVDELSAENERLTDAVNESGWEAQITAIVEKVDPKDVADAVYGGTERPVVMGLTDAMVRRYADMAKCEPPASTMELLMNARRLADPQAFVKDNSQRARQYADAILNQLDGQTDETNDERLARRIINGRGPAAAQSLAQAIVALIQKRIDPEESEQPAAELLAGHPQDATQASVEGVSEVEEDEAAIAERLAASMTDAEKIAAKERLDEIMAQAEKGDVLVTGAGYHLGNVPADDPRATSWKVTVFDPACSIVKGFQTREVADAKAEAVRQFPVEVRSKALLFDPRHPSYPTLVETPPSDVGERTPTPEQVREAVEKANWSTRSVDSTAEMQEGLPDPILGEVVVLGHITKARDANVRIPKDHPSAFWWYLYIGKSRRGGVVWSFVKEYEKGFGTLEDAETAVVAYTAALAAGASMEARRNSVAAEARRNDAQEPEKKKRGPKPKPKLDEFGRPARPEIGDKHIGASGVVEIFVTAEDGRKRGEWVVQKAETVQPGEAPWPPPPQEARVPRFGQKRVIGKCRDSYFPAGPADPPGSVERYYLEVYQATDAAPEGVWIRCGGEGWETHDEAAKFL